MLGLVTPSMAVTLVRNLLERDLKKDIPNFSLIYMSDKVTSTKQDKIYFEIDGIKHNIDQDLADKLKSLLMAKIDKKTLQYMDGFKALANSSNQLDITVLITDEKGIKKTEKQTLK